MKIGKKHALGENLLYLLVWSAIILVPVLNSQMLSELHVNLDEAWIVWRQIIPYVVIFLVHNHLIAPRYLLKKRYALYLLSNVIFVTIVFVIIDFYQMNIGHVSLYGSFTNHEVYWNILFALFMNGTNGGIKLLYQSLLDEQQMLRLKEENLRAEMTSLKYQINPHFFMNTLNNIHALIDIDTEAAKSAVIDLSKMMRYVLYDSEREMISLSADLQFLRNYIELMRIRYTDHVQITIDAPQTLPEKVAIPPLLLIVFVENAFKHGVSYNHPSYIHISLFYADKKLTAIISNSRNPQPTSPTRQGGIGLENVRKRLDLLYGPHGYSLDICQEEERYTVKLVIPTLHA
ncbi:MAG: regulator [Rikenellaceae bacterium]|nr:regulator [Rikenellaceae bacterium]MBR3774029.1 histidine kinase [Alistipes sp.]